MRTELQLRASHVDHRMTVTGRVGRCRIFDLDPIRYRGVVEFDRVIELVRIECN